MSPLKQLSKFYYGTKIIKEALCAHTVTHTVHPLGTGCYIFTQKLIFRVTIHVNNETLGSLFTSKYPISVPLCEPESHGHFRPHTHQYMIYCINQHINRPNSPYIATDCVERAPKILTFRPRDLGPIKWPLTASINSSINKVLKQRVNSIRIKLLPHRVC